MIQNHIFRNFDTLFDALLPEVTYHNWSNDHVIPMNLIETEQEYIFQFDVGVAEKENVSISLDKGNLSIIVDKNLDDSTSGKYLVKEILKTKSSRIIKLNNYMNFTAEPTATLEKGILNIRMPKYEQIKNKRIMIA